MGCFSRVGFIVVEYVMNLVLVLFLMLVFVASELSWGSKSSRDLMYLAQGVFALVHNW